MTHSTRGGALTATSAATGFHSRTTLDESPETQRKIRLAVARAKEGDQEAVRFLYVTYVHNIYGYVRSIVRDDHEAEDVTQHVFAKLMTAIVKYDDRGVPFFAWLLRMARNVAIDQLRANRLTPTENVIDPDTSTQHRPRPDRDSALRTGHAARRAASGRHPAARRRAHPRRDRRPDGPQRGLDPRPAPSRPARAAARAGAAGLDAAHPQVTGSSPRPSAPRVRVDPHAESGASCRTPGR